MSLSNPSHEEVAAYAARQGITLEEAQAYFLDLLVGQTEYEMTGEGPEFAAPAPMFDLGEQRLIDATEKKMIGPTTEWAVDPVNGNDENSGEPGHPLKTMAEFARRNQGRAAYAPDGLIAINVLSDLKVEIE